MHRTSYLESLIFFTARGFDFRAAPPETGFFLSEQRYARGGRTLKIPGDNGERDSRDGYARAPDRVSRARTSRNRDYVSAFVRGRGPFDLLFALPPLSRSVLSSAGRIVTLGARVSRWRRE